jgi:4'-phosphopantetheinyl transferase
MERVEVHVVALDLPPDRVRALARTLDAGERDRARRFTDAGVARRFTVARAALRALLAERTGCSARALRFEIDAAGRPRLAGARLAFSASRSGERALIALASAGPLGVDVERIEPRREDADVAASFFPPEVCAAWSALPPAERAPAFFRRWTLSEAYLKATGTGFATAPGPIRCERLGPGGDLRAFPLELGPDYAATLVARRASRVACLPGALPGGLVVAQAQQHRMA